MNQFEQLLTCAICLDRYRNPKLLPCQHSFCMEPCMDGLVDYVRRQVKCPECRAEHRIPYQGVQGFPTNVTLQRFLELHVEITGELPDPTSGQIMERCNVCSEKAYCGVCVHCDKKICPECKEAHMDILRREIARINNQVRRGLHRLQDILQTVEKNSLSFQTNYTSVQEEVDEIYRRLSKALKDRTEYLRSELDRYTVNESRILIQLKESLEQEISNIESNCDLADKYMTDDVEWNDYELMDTKDIFLKTVDFIRNFECETSDYNRKIRFIMNNDPNQLVLHVANYGDLNIAQNHSNVNSSGINNNLLQPSSGGQPSGLMRSKSDHRLTSQFRQQDDRLACDDDQQHLGGRKFGERYRPQNDRHGYGGRSGGDCLDDYELENSRPPRSRFRSRFVKHGDEIENENQTSKGVRFNEQHQKERERVLDTEDVARGPLSGISRLYDSPRVMQRLQEFEDRGKKKIKEIPKPSPPKTVIQSKRIPVATPPSAQRQISEDEIDRIKKQNKGASTSQEETLTQKPTSDRVAALKQIRSINSEDEDSRKSGTPSRNPEISSGAESDESLGSLQQTQRKTASMSTSRRSSAGSDSQQRKSNRSTSSESSDSTTSGSSAIRNTGSAYTTEEVKKKLLSHTPVKSIEKKEPTNANLNKTTPNKTYTTPNKTYDNKTQNEEESDSSSEEETETESESEPEVKNDKAMAKTDIGPLLARSAQARESSVESSRRNSRDDTNFFNKPKYPTSTSSYKDESRFKPKTTVLNERESPPTSTYNSRFLNKSKSSAIVPNDEDTRKHLPTSPLEEDDPKFPTSGRARYMALKDRRSRLARSKSSHNFGGDDDDVEETNNPNAYLASRGYGASVTGINNDLSRSKSSHALKSRENSPERPSTTSSNASGSDGAALSSWARYLRNKYGNKTGNKENNPRDASSSSALNTPTSSAVSRRLSLGLPLRNEVSSTDDDSKNMLGSPTTPTATTATGIAAVTGTSTRNQYLQKRRQLFKIGSRGSEPGCFTWPRGVAVGPDNTIVVADSSNHRVQVFDSHGSFLKEFGQYGTSENEFDCLAGVAVNRIGQYIIADRYNHRIQVFDPSGRFLRTFGSQGTVDGRFNYPWGITTDALGFIYVCDKENHRVQVFQSDGTFVGKFGSCGSKPGQLEHPLYIAVSNTNRVIVSDSNNHRIQIFDVNGRVLSSIGSEGSEAGQFKFPRGVAVDDQGYIFVADSGNNRIQIFTPDGQYLNEFGCWGSGDVEFKGIEGIAVMSNGNLLVCDRENHRVLAFS